MTLSTLRILALSLVAAHAAQANWDDDDWRLINIPGPGDNILELVVDDNGNGAQKVEVPGSVCNVDGLEFKIENKRVQVDSIKVAYLKANGNGGQVKDDVRLKPSNNPNPNVYGPEDGWTPSVGKHVVIQSGPTGQCVDHLLVDARTVNSPGPQQGRMKIRLYRRPMLQPESLQGKNILFTPSSQMNDGECGPGTGYSCDKQTDRARVLIEECGLAKINVEVQKISDGEKKQVDLKKVRIYFANGSTQEREFVYNLSEGERREIELQGERKRCVRAVDLIGNTRVMVGNPEPAEGAKILVYGQKYD